MKKAKLDFSGVVSVTKVVHGIEVRGLNFADISAQWQSNGARLIDAYDEIIKAGESINDDTLTLVNAIIKHAPDLARASFLAAINDKGEVHELDGQELTAGEIWDTKMSVGKQADFLIAIIELTLTEADDLKKKLMGWTSNLKVIQPNYQTTTAMVEAAITQ